jgi:hypothetical protein
MTNHFCYTHAGLDGVSRRGSLALSDFGVWIPDRLGVGIGLLMLIFFNLLYLHALFLFLALLYPFFSNTSSLLLANHQRQAPLI